MKLCDYWDRLNRADWFAAMSDDYTVAAWGEAELIKLLEIARPSPEHMKLYDGFRNHAYSGPSYGTPTPPKPERPDEQV